MNLTRHCAVVRPTFPTVTGSMFAKSIAWAKTQPANPITLALARAIKKPTK